LHTKFLNNPMVKITLPDGSIREYEGVITPIEVAKSISEGLARNTISAIVNGTQVETTTEITEDSTLQLLTWNDDMGKKAFWHSSAHLLAQAILAYFPEAKLTIGPAIDNGFYYDVDFGDQSLSEKDFEKIEKKMLDFTSLLFPKPMH
jgi:threonyl-tRNA synthetase